MYVNLGTRSINLDSYLRNSKVADKGVSNIAGLHLVGHQGRLARASLFPRGSMIVVIVNGGERGTPDEEPGSYEAAWGGCRL